MEKRPVNDFATDFDHTDPAWVRDPYPIWEDLRERCPVAHTDRYGGAWFPTTYEMVQAVASDSRHFSSRVVVVSNEKFSEWIPEAPVGNAPPITSDPPFHAIARRLMLPALAPGVVNKLEPGIRQLCAARLDELEGQREFDAAGAYTQFISPGVIAQMLGFPEHDEERFRDFVHLVLDSVDQSPEELAPGWEFMAEYFDRQIQDHVAFPRSDFTSYLLNVEIDGQPLSYDHVRGTMALMLIAGIDTTWSAIGAAIWHLASNPSDLARLVAEPDVMALAVEEFLRFYAPVTMARTVKEEFEFFGVTMKKDDWVLLGFPAANRDPAAFDDADRFIIDRAVNRHAAFGLGIHRCAGSNLARLELRVAIEEFIARYPHFELADPEAVTWSPGQVRGPRCLPIRILEG